MQLFSYFSRISTSRFIAFLRSVYLEGALSFDPLSEEEPKEPSDGKLLGMVVDFFGGAEAVFDREIEE